MSNEFEHELIENIPHLRAFGRFMTRNLDEADDLVQETLVQALRARDQYQPGTNLKAWTFTILRNLHISNTRRHGRVESLGQDALEKLTSAPDQHVNLRIEEVRRALAKLTPEHREIILLIAGSGFHCYEAAAICGCAVGTVKSRLSRARWELFRLLSGDGPACEGTETSRRARTRPRRMSDAVALLLAA